MTTNDYALFALLRANNWGEDIKLPEGTACDELYTELIQQSVSILSRDVINSIPFGELPQEKLNNARMKQVAQFMRYLNAQRQLTMVLEAEGIKPVILKGIAAASYYRDPILRVLGDIDFIVPKEEFDRAREILLGSGYTSGWGESNEKRHLDLTKDGIPFEMHRCFLEEEPPKDGDGADASIFASLADAPLVHMYGFSFYMLPDEEHGISILQHIRHHLAGGIGLRQVMDWLNFVNRKLDDAFWFGSMLERVKELGLEKFAITLTYMGEIFLGLPKNGRTWYADADSELCVELMELLLANGNFGRKHGNSRNKTIAVLTSMRQGLFKRLKRAGEINDTYEGKGVAFRYVRQIIRYIKQGFNSGQSIRTLHKDINASRKQTQLFKKLGIQ